jgi:hypothetical protein
VFGSLANSLQGGQDSGSISARKQSLEQRGGVICKALILEGERRDQEQKY